MSRKHRPQHKRPQLSEVHNATLSAVVSALVRFLLDQLRGLL